MWIVGTDHSADGSNLSLIDPASPVNANSKFYTSAKWSELHWNYEADATIAQADFSLDKMLNLESPGIDISTPPQDMTHVHKVSESQKRHKGQQRRPFRFQG